MSILLVILLVVMVVSLVLLALLLLDVPIIGFGSSDRQYRAMFTSQRSAAVKHETERKKKSEDAFEDAKARTRKNSGSAKLTLEKKIRYANWSISPFTYYLWMVSISGLAFLLGSLFLGVLLLAATLLAGPIFMGYLLRRAIDKRFKDFDKDYAPFLLSVVGLIKTGMNPISAIEAASQGLEQGAMVRVEVEVMMERLRYGVPEDASIGSFAEDVFHPEVELFVQALLLSRAVGGTLSNTLDRLARQTRKRQHFRNSAKAAVSMQRGAIWVILGIMAALKAYLWYMYPEIIEGALFDETGWQVWQIGITFILLGIFFINQVTRVKV